MLVPLQLLLSFDYDCKSAASARMTISMVVWLFGMALVDKKMADALLESGRQLCRCGFVIDWNGFTMRICSRPERNHRVFLISPSPISAT